MENGDLGENAGVAFCAPANSGDQNRNRQVYGAEINLKDSFSFRLNIQKWKRRMKNKGKKIKV